MLAGLWVTGQGSGLGRGEGREGGGGNLRERECAHNVYVFIRAMCLCGELCISCVCEGVSLCEGVCVCGSDDQRRFMTARYDRNVDNLHIIQCAAYCNCLHTVYSALLTDFPFLSAVD